MIVSPLTFKETKSEWRSQILIAGARNPKEDGPVEERTCVTNCPMLDGDVEEGGERQLSFIKIVTLPSSFTSCGYYHYGYGSFAREATISKHSPDTMKPPLPQIFSWYVHNDTAESSGAKTRQKVPLLISNEELSKPQAATTDDSDAEGSVDDGSQIALPQYFGSDFYDDPCFMPCGVHHQAPTNTTSKLIDEGFNFETLTENIIMHYGLWGNLQGSNTNNKGHPNTIDGSFYLISHNPFDPIRRPCNAFGPTERPFPHLPSSHELADLCFV
ncbi:LOW QUALITY PROTEIN: hypothetical protein HID58_093190 [Brassica napus]|uniref:Uncharacterized protein n=1 Tax=Brassica napus TaxID=3708 RepID=A0ABQ7XBT3_BRANA|nr:LOW QUALITY PROTEIN: hypothetical protein HID58_093190 [Brassica napus]